jgi:hypothetical protein
VPPTFLIYLAALVYIPTLLTALVAGTTLLCIPRTRRVGMRLVCAAAATVPGLAIAGALAGLIGVLLLGYFATLRLFIPRGEIRNPFAIGVVAFATLDTAILMGIVTIVVVSGSAHLGWGLGGLSPSRLIEWLRWLPRLGRLAAIEKTAAQQGGEADEARDG